MGKVDLQGIGQKLGVLKDYTGLLVSALIAVVAVIVLVVTPILLGSRLEQKVKTRSLSLANRIKGLSGNVVSEGELEAEKAYYEQYAHDVNAITRLVRGTTRRELLSYEVFPQPKDDSVMLFENFGKNYMSGIEGLVSMVRGGDCPSQEELQTYLKRSGYTGGVGARSNVLAGLLGGAGYGPYGGSTSTGVTALQRKIEDALCREKAGAAGVYVKLSDVAGYDFWKNYKSNVSVKEAVQDCWYWQLGYWIVEDVFKTIQAMNSKAGSSSVLDAPVKRLLYVDFSKGIGFRGLGGAGGSMLGGFGSMGGAGRTRSGAASTKPAYVVTASDRIAQSYTGRLCDAEIDVVQFNLGVVVRAGTVLQFMEELCSAKEHKFYGFDGKGPEQTFEHNQITVLNSTVSPVVRESQEHMYYRYGEDPVVQLRLVCEYIFDKNGYARIKPKVVTEAVSKRKSSTGGFGLGRGRAGAASGAAPGAAPRDLPGAPAK